MPLQSSCALSSPYGIPPAPTYQERLKSKDGEATICILHQAIHTCQCPGVQKHACSTPAALQSLPKGNQNTLGTAHAGFSTKGSSYQTDQTCTSPSHPPLPHKMYGCQAIRSRPTEKHQLFTSPTSADAQESPTTIHPSYLSLSTQQTKSYSTNGP
jgi:hypothetical protein